MADDEKTAADEATKDEVDPRDLLSDGQGEDPVEEQAAPADTPDEGEQKQDEVAEGGTPDPTPAGDGKEETTSTTEEESGSSFLDSLRQMGWDGDNEADAQSALLHAFQAQNEDIQRLKQHSDEQEELARHGAQFLKEQRESDEARASAEGQKQGSEKQENWWNPPAFDASSLEKYRDVTIGEDGEPAIGWKKGTPQEIIQSATQYQEYLDRWATDLVQRPQEVLPKIIEKEFDRLFEERISARDQASQLENFAAEVKETNSDWMYQQDVRGNEVLTPEGQVMTQLLAEVAEDGISDPRRQWEYAVARYDYMNRTRDSAVEEKTNQTRETASKKRREHVQHASGNLQNRGGTVPRPGETETSAQNPHLSPGEQLVENLRRAGAEF